MWRMSETPAGSGSPAGPIGADTDAVLDELGIPADEREALRPRKSFDDRPDRQLLDAVGAGLRVVDLGRMLTVGMPQSPTTRRTGTPTRAVTATWCAPTAARPPTT